MNHRRNVVCPLQFYFQPDGERLFHQGQGFRLGGIHVFHEQLAAIDGGSQRRHPGGKHIVRAEFAYCNDSVSAYDVGHQAADLLKISNVIAQQLSVRFRELGGAHSHVELVKLACVKKFARRRGRQFEAFRRLNLVQLLQNSIAVRSLRLTEDVKTSKPCRERDSGQKQNRNRPREITDALRRTRVRLVVRIVRLGTIVHQFSAR